MNASNQDRWGKDPATGMSARDAMLLAVRNLIWLIVLPLALTLITSVVYMQLPTQASASAVLNLDLDLFNLHAKPIIDDLPASTTVSTAAGSSIVAVSVDAPDAQTALTVLERIIETAPEPKMVASSLTDAQGLELRALRQYRQDMQQRLAAQNLDPTTISTLNVEITAAETRIAFLEERDVPPKSISKVAQEPTAVAIRRPPLANVVIFSFLASLFATWCTIYQIERRRIIREKGML